jgi:phenylalanyl-tRNA synthetase beta chain
MKISYNWLKWYIPEVPPAEKLVDIFNYHLCEMESLEKLSNGDIIFDIKVLPNRAHDLLSHQGIAKELASLLNIKFVDPTSKYKIPASKTTSLKIEIESNKCRRYMGRIVRNVKIGPSPEWMVQHLEAIGQRSINNMVDTANLVMFDCGQPTHVFDLNKVSEKLIVRVAKDGEELTTLDNKECKLESSYLIIADTKNVLAIAGVKGGKIAEVDNNTTDIILEVANFEPTSVRKTAQALNIVTDAKKRFENDLSPELCSYAVLEFSALILEICPTATFEEIVDVYPQKQEIKKLSFSIDKISKILGLTVSSGEVEDILKKYGFSTEDTSASPGEFTITVPPMRLDLIIEEDMAEEIGRILGYDKVKGKIPQIDFKPKINDTYMKIIFVRNKLLDDGYSEVFNTTFSNTGEVSVLASASDKNFLRANLTDGLKESIKLNQANAPLLGIEQAKIFEIGTVWNPIEEMHVAYGDKKGIKEITIDEFTKNSEAQTLYTHSNGCSTSVRFKMWSLFPFIARDIAVWVPDAVENNKVEKIIKENMGDMVVRGPELFDEFKKPASPAGGDGKISYAFRLVFQSYDRTLTDQEVNNILAKITEKITEKKDWQVR